MNQDEETNEPLGKPSCVSSLASVSSATAYLAALLIMKCKDAITALISLGSEGGEAEKVSHDMN
jgi:hypothetical protein